MNNLIVKAGDILTATLWNAFWRERRRQRLVGGPGVLVNDSPDGQIISFRAAAGAFVPEFEVRLTGRTATFGKGFVNGFTPVLEGDRPITGVFEDGTKDTRGVPRLELSEAADLYDTTGRSWLVLKVQVDAVGRIIAPAEDGTGKLMLTIEQRAKCPSTDPADSTIGYKAIAMLRRPKTATAGIGTLEQIAMFDYKHFTSRNGSKFRHFFVPA